MVCQNDDIVVENMIQWCRRLFPEQAVVLCRLVHDVAALYRGEAPEWQRCQVPYHNIEHVCAVTQVALQIYAGDCRQHKRAVQLEHLRVLIAAALLHDSGYLKAVDDNSLGSGGQYTFEHVGRSQQLAQSYLATQPGWNAEQRQTVAIIIGATKIVAENLAVDAQTASVAPDVMELMAVLGSADLWAQVADPDYLEKLPLLYAEFAEAYERYGREDLRRRGFTVFTDVEQLLTSSGDFIRYRVLPRLHDLGDKELALQSLYGQKPSPYMRQLQINLQRMDELAAAK